MTDIAPESRRKPSVTARLWGETRIARPALVQTVLYSALTALIILLQARLLSTVIDRVFLKSASLDTVTPVLLGLAGVVALRGLLAYGGVAASAALAAAVKRSLRERLLARLFAFSPVSLTSEHSGELVVTTLGGVEKLDGYYREYVPGLLTALIVPLLILLTVVPLDTLTFAVLLVTAPLIPLFMALIGMGAGALARRQFETMQHLSGHFVDVMQGLTTLKLFNRSRAQVRVIAHITDSFRRATMQVLRVAFLSALSLEMLATLSVAIVAVEIGVRLIHGGIAFESALFLLVIAPEFYQPLRTLGAKFHTGTEGKSAAERIYALLDAADPALPAGDDAAEGMIAADLIPSGLHFEQVTFRYAPDAPPALEDVTLTIPAGQDVALVGMSGSGKSTLAALLLRFITPQQGHIRAGEVPLDAIPAEVWRSRLAWVPQQPVLLNTSIAENIRLGKPGAPLAEVIAATEAAGAHEFISTLPDGYETPCGERGLRLSGGQAQRIAIARAFLRDAPLLILDEPTSQLDTATEAQINTALVRLKHGRTVLTIAHRLETVRHADQIVLLEAGRIIEQGTHDALLARGGAYARLHAAGDLQADPAHAVSVMPANVPAFAPAASAHSTKAAVQGVAHSGAAGDASPTGASPAAAEPRPLLRLVRQTRPYALRMGLAVLLGFLTIASSVALMATSAWMISKSGLRPSIADLGVSVVGVRFFGITRGVFRYLERVVAHDTTFRLLAQMRVAFYAALEPLAPAGLTDFRSGDLLSRVISDIESLQNIFLRGIAPPLVAIVTAIGTTVFLALFSPVIAALVIAAMFAAGVLLPVWSAGQARPLRTRRLETRADFSADLLDALQGMADLAVYGQTARWQARMGVPNAALARQDLDIAHIDGLQSAGLTLLTHLAAVGALALAISRIDGLFLATVTLATVAAFEAFLPIAQAALQLGEDRAAAQRLFAVADLPLPVRDPDSPAPLPSQAPRLALRDVRFAYAAGQPLVFDGLTLDIAPAGERIAIIGPSGVGKSTLIRLLLRFWDYDQGSITLGDHPLRAYAAEDVRRVIGVLEQQPHIFNTTLRENIRIGRSEATDAEVIAAAQKAQLHTFIQTLPQGYATFVGEQGRMLSAGQRQRLALARLLLKDAPILILDEPTANLDSTTERAILETILDQTAGRTLLLITHRAQLLDQMDRVVTLGTAPTPIQVT